MLDPIFAYQKQYEMSMANTASQINPSSPGDLLRFQQDITNYSVATGAASGALHALQQMMQGIAQKIG
jgi:hypothetical protein